MSPIWRKRTRTGWRGGVRHVYVSYHKTATQYTERVLRAVCAHHRLRPVTFDARHPTVDDATLERADFLLLTDFTSSMVDLDRIEARGLRIIRDPRDTLVSMYFSHASSHAPNHAEITRNRAALRRMDVQEGLDFLMTESAFFTRIVRELDAWRDRGYHETTYERLTADPFATFSEALEALGLSVGDRRLKKVLERNAFKRLQKEWARKNPAAPVNHYRSGASGDWRRHLTGPARERFRSEYGHLLIKLGYETTLDW